MDTELRWRALERALRIAGSREALCARLGVQDHALALWLNRAARVPDRVFDSAVDLILEDDLARAAQDRRGEPRRAENTPDGSSNGLPR